MKVSSGEERGRGERGDPNTIMEPDNASNRLMRADIFSKGPEPQRFGVF